MSTSGALRLQKQVAQHEAPIASEATQDGGIEIRHPKTGDGYQLSPVFFGFDPCH